MSNIIIVHAIEMHPAGIWYPYLKEKLEALGHTVSILSMPTPSAPKADEWLQTLEQAVSSVKAPETVLVGHSLGGVNVLRFLQRHDVEKNGKFAGVILVATMTQPVGYDVLSPFFAGGFDWGAIKASTQQMRTLTAMDDPVLIPDPAIHVKTLVEKGGATAIIKPIGGHFPVWSPEIPAILPELPEVLELVKQCLPKQNA